jgi:mRNA interferase MazF
VIRRGEVWWAGLGEPRGSGPGFRRPVVIVQSDSFNRSRLATVVAVALTSNLKLVAAPGNVRVRAGEAGLPKDSVANVSQVVTLDRRFLMAQCGRLSPGTMKDVDRGLRLALSL